MPCMESVGVVKCFPNCITNGFRARGDDQTNEQTGKQAKGGSVPFQETWQHSRVNGIRRPTSCLPSQGLGLKCPSSAIGPLLFMQARLDAAVGVVWRESCCFPEPGLIPRQTGVIVNCRDGASYFQVWFVSEFRLHTAWLGSACRRH